MGRNKAMAKHPVILRLLLVLGGLLVGFVLLEVGLRIGVECTRLPIYEIDARLLMDPEIEGVHYIYRPDLEDFTNNLGLRMPRDVEPRKAPGTLRILLLSDSVGESIDKGEGTEGLFPCLLEGLLSSRMGIPVEVLNLSVPGLSFEQERRLFEVRRREWEPDAAIFAYNFNDPVETDVRSVYNFRRNPWLETVNTIRRIRYQRDVRQDLWYFTSSDTHQRLSASFDRLGQTARDFPVFLVPMPLLLSPGEPQPHIPAVTRLCEDNGIHVLDIYGALKEDLPGFFITETPEDTNHYGAAGHRAIAEAIADRAAPLLPRVEGP